MRIFFSMLFVVASFGCAHQSSTSDDDAEHMRPIGGDTDAHGCLIGAGYSWCGKTQQCEQPWILADQAGFDLSKENYDAYCGNAPEN